MGMDSTWKVKPETNFNTFTKAWQDIRLFSYSYLIIYKETTNQTCQ